MTQGHTTLSTQSKLKYFVRNHNPSASLHSVNMTFFFFLVALQSPFDLSVKSKLSELKSKFSTDLKRLANRVIAGIERWVYYFTSFINFDFAVSSTIWDGCQKRYQNVRNIISYLFALDWKAVSKHINYSSIIKCLRWMSKLPVTCLYQIEKQCQNTVIIQPDPFKVLTPKILSKFDCLFLNQTPASQIYKA